jgi:hypothetical protein
MPELQRNIQEASHYGLLGQGFEKSHSVLVLECNPPALAPLLSATANQLPELLSAQIHSDVISVSNEFEFLQRLNELKAAQLQYSLIVVLGEGNASRLTLAEDQSLSWAEFTYQTLLPFEPEYLLIISAGADRDIPAHTFFEAVPMLKEVYTSPVTDSKLQTDMLKFMVSYLANPAPFEYDRVFSTQIAEKLLSSGVLMRWTWRDSLKQRVLNTFEMLTDTEKLEVAADIIRRTAQSTNNRFATTPANSVE